jgi:hypothetical protein
VFKLNTKYLCLILTQEVCVKFPDKNFFRVKAVRNNKLMVVKKYVNYMAVTNQVKLAIDTKWVVASPFGITRQIFFFYKVGLSDQYP